MVGFSLAEEINKITNLVITSHPVGEHCPTSSGLLLAPPLAQNREVEKQALCIAMLSVDKFCLAHSP